MTVQLLPEQRICPKFLYCGSVAALLPGRRGAVACNRSCERVRVLCYEDYPKSARGRLMRRGVVDWTLGGEKDESRARFSQADHGPALVFVKTVIHRILQTSVFWLECFS